MKECNKKIRELSICKDRVDECEFILERYQKAGKDLKYYEDKFVDFTANQREINILTEANDRQIKAISYLNSEITELKAENSQIIFKLKRMNRLEQTKLELEDKIKGMKDEYHKIINNKADLSFEVCAIKIKLLKKHKTL